MILTWVSFSEDCCVRETPVRRSMSRAPTSTPSELVNATKKLNKSWNAIACRSSTVSSGRSVD